MKAKLLSITCLLSASATFATTLVQTDSSFIAFDATSFTSASNWTAIADTTTTPSLSGGSVMVYADSDGPNGIDGSTQNVFDISDPSSVGAANTDKLTYTIDFTNDATYFLYLRLDSAFLAAGNNDSLYVPSGDIEGAATLNRNNLNNGFPTSGYSWYNVASYAVDSTEGTAGNTISFSLAGRERDLQLDRLVFSTTNGLSDSALDALAIVPEPSAYALIAGSLALGWIMTRRRQ